MDFDTRQILLTIQIQDAWDEDVKALHRQNAERVRRGLLYEFGEFNSELKANNFIDIDTKPFSVLAYHNSFFDQIRSAFVIGAYYPALVGACTLAERILNHLIIDLRPFYPASAEYKRVYRKSSFDDWRLPISVLTAWNVLLPEAATEFEALMPLRHRSIHFNAETYLNLRDDALAAILHVRKIIDQQFSSHALRPWFIKGTTGHVFIRKDFEEHPFIKTYFIPRCPFVGPLFGLGHGPNGWEVYDYPDYGVGDWTDQEFAAEYNQRDPAKVAAKGA